MEAIVLDNVSLDRRTQEEFSYDLKKLLFTIVERGFRKTRRRRVLQNVSLTVERGEKLGIIGGNGSGKSTILKVMCGILAPTEGRLRVAGRIAPLIELGAGFDPELTVSDNVVYYGNLLGFSRADMRARLQRILAFAELQEYALLPLKALSSGMNARLGFAIATDVRPEILILDEVLSVGDEAFRNKSTERIARFWDAHSTIIVVSHDLGFIAQQCERAVWIDKGVICATGPAADVVALYLAHVADTEPPAVQSSEPPKALGYVDEAHIAEGLLFVRGWMLAGPDGAGGGRVAVLHNGEYLGDAAYGEQRDDVAASYAFTVPSACGFSGSFALPAAALEHERHHLECVLFDGADAPLHRLTADSLSTHPPASRFAVPH